MVSLRSLAAATLCTIHLASARTRHAGSAPKDKGRGAGELAANYNYVIVGGGAAGLAVANRLSEDSAVTVLVIEAGPIDENEDIVTVPGLAGGAIGSKYDFNRTYAPQPGLGDRAPQIPLGKVLGGSTKLNRMVFDRGSQTDYNRWAELGNAGWDWDALRPYFLKTETFTGPSKEIADTWGVKVEPESHGSDGPIQVSYSQFFWPLNRPLIDATLELGITVPVDQASGSPIGGYFSPHNIDPNTTTRSSAREGYYEPIKTRENLDMITGHSVTKLVLSRVLPPRSELTPSDAIVTSVEFADSEHGERKVVNVDREVIMAAGAIHTPQILQVSGIGAKSLLEKIDVPVVVDLPAVGENLQDHVLLVTAATVESTEMQVEQLQSDAPFAAAALAEYKANGTGPYSSPTGDFLLFLPVADYTNATLAPVDGTPFLLPDTPAEVAAGHRRAHDILHHYLPRRDAAMLELVQSGGVSILGLQHPFARGRVRAQTKSIFDAPLATPNLLGHPLDVQALVEAVKFTRRLRATAAFTRALRPVETVPGANVTEDADIEAFVRAAASSLYHPAGSCKMGPREEGGVVDGKLLVYGTRNLRVVDASAHPLLPAAHTMTTTYAVAEKAADIIKGR